MSFSVDRFGALGEQVQLHVGVLGGGAGEHRADQARLELLQVAHRRQRGTALRLERLSGVAPPNRRW